MCELEDCGMNPFGLYRVREGDTLASLCARFSLPPALAAACCGGRFPPAGALLQLPSAVGRLYTVQAGETLASLCKKFGMSEGEFREKNACSYVYPTQLVLVNG